MRKKIEIAVGYTGHEQELTHWLNAHVAESLQSFTVIHGEGYWRGIREKSAIVSWIVSAASLCNSHTLAAALAAKYCELTGEKCALVSSSPITTAELVDARMESFGL